MANHENEKPQAEMAHCNASQFLNGCLLFSCISSYQKDMEREQVIRVLLFINVDPFYFILNPQFSEFQLLDFLKKSGTWKRKKRN